MAAGLRPGLRARAGDPDRGPAYFDFLSPGILSQSVPFIAIFHGISVIWERDLGIVHKFLVSRAPRSALVLGKAISAGLRALTQATIASASWASGRS